MLALSGRLLSVFGFVVVVGCAPPDRGVGPPVELTAFLVEGWRAPSVAVAVAIDGRIVHSEASGWADVDAQAPASPTSLYRIASVSKPITAIAVLQLVERGAVDLDDEIQEYVPSFPEKRWPVTVRHVLQHASGIRHYKPGETSRKTEHYETVADAIVLFKDDSLLFEPGTRESYTTYGYTLLQGVIETASGRSFEDYLRENIWVPSGVDDPPLDTPGRAPADRVQGYELKGSTLSPVPEDNVSFKYAGGGMLASAEGLVRICLALGEGKLLGPQYVDTLFSQHGEFTFGWGIAVGDDGLKQAGHFGRSYGFESRLLYYPDIGLAVAVLSNQDFTDVSELGRAANAYAHRFMPLRYRFLASELEASKIISVAGEQGVEAGVARYRQEIARRERELDALRYQILEGAYRLGNENPQDAAPALTMLYEVHPDDPRIVAGMGDLHYYQDQFAEARSYFERAARLAPDWAPYRERIAEIDARLQ